MATYTYDRNGQIDGVYIGRRSKPAKKKTVRVPRYRVTVKRIDGEWAAAFFEDGKLCHARTYFSGGEDAGYRADAEATAKKMREINRREVAALRAL